MAFPLDGTHAPVGVRIVEQNDTQLDVAFITSEPQLHHAVQLAYGLNHVSGDDELEAIAAGWRSFRTWVSVLLTIQYYQATNGVAPTVRKRGQTPSRRRSTQLHLRPPV